jgi:hypothetical protein
MIYTCLPFPSKFMLSVINSSNYFSFLYQKFRIEEKKQDRDMHFQYFQFNLFLGQSTYNIFENELSNKKITSSFISQFIKLR